MLSIMQGLEYHYAVVINTGTPFINDLGQMTDSQLFGYLNCRPLVGYTPEQVLDVLERESIMKVEFDDFLSGKLTVAIRSVTHH